MFTNKNNQKEQKRKPKKASKTNVRIIKVILAAERVLLANERTFLAYLRSALALIGGGVALIKFFDHRMLAIAGWFLLPTGVVTLVWGFLRFRRTHNRLRAFEIDEYRKAFDSDVEADPEDLKVLEALVQPEVPKVERQMDA